MCTCDKMDNQPLMSLFLVLILISSQPIFGHLCNNYWMNLCDKYAVPIVHKRNKDVTLGNRDVTGGNHDVTMGRRDAVAMHDSVAMDNPDITLATANIFPQTRGCRANMKRFMCQLIKHTCVLNSEDQSPVFLPPCRETCVRLYSRCLPERPEHGVSWSDFVQCNALPEAASGFCQVKYPVPPRGKIR